MIQNIHSRPTINCRDFRLQDVCASITGNRSYLSLLFACGCGAKDEKLVRVDCFNRLFGCADISKF
jgi:hypothetical protein